MTTGLFADVALAARIESAEARLQRRVVDAAKDGDAEAAFAQEIAGGVATYLRPGSPLNKIIGIGFEAPLNEEELSGIERLYFERGEPVRFEVATLCPSDAGRRLTERGYRLLGFENVLGCVPAQRDDVETPLIKIEKVTAPHLDRWAQVAISGFSAPDDTGIALDEFSHDVIARVITDMVAVPGFERYLALYDAVPAGAASTFLESGIALFTGAATLREYRQRGIQRALLAHRLVEARQKAAALAVVTTAAGTRSQSNVMRYGFSLLYSRAILELPCARG